MVILLYVNVLKYDQVKLMYKNHVGQMIYKQQLISADQPPRWNWARIYICEKFYCFVYEIILIILS